MKYIFPILFLLFSLNSFTQTICPQDGSLMVVGGGPANELIKKFVEIAGGEKARIVIIPTAGNGEEFGEDYSYSQTIKDFGAIGKITINDGGIGYQAGEYIIFHHSGSFIIDVRR